MFCRSCGARLGEGVRFCQTCGVPAVGDAAGNTPPPGATPSGATPGGATPPFAGSVGPPVATGPRPGPFPPSAPSVPPPIPSVPPVAARSQPVRADERRRTTQILGLVAAMSLLAGLAGAWLTRPTEAGEIVASLPVGPEGGSISFGHRARIDIPAGALEKEQTITIRQARVNQRVRVRPPGGAPPRVYPPGTLIVYIFGPIDIVFRLPVTIVLPLPDPGVPGIVFILLNGQLNFIGGTVDAAGGTIMIQTQDFRFASQTQVINP